MKACRLPEPRSRGGFDLHVHTTHSDGLCSPGEVVRNAAEVGLAGLAITDHDSLSAIAIARPEADRLGITLISGIELTAESDGRELHVLGYAFDPDDHALRTAADDLRHRRAERIRAMTDKLASLGLHVDLKALGRMFPRATLGRRHLAEWLTRSGQVSSHREAFIRFLGDDGPATVPKPRLPVAAAVDLICCAGGVAGLAHPPYDLKRETLQRLVEAGLGAVETAGPGTTARLARRWGDWAVELDLIPTAGSDFHAPDRPGRWVGSITTAGAIVERLLHRREISATASHSIESPS
jgi:predicted metal-dependent phosphoesterase TrpH